MSERAAEISGKTEVENLKDLDKTALIKKLQSQKTYIEQLEGKLNTQGEGDENAEKEKRQVSESSRRENVLVMRLATKEQEVQELNAQIDHMQKAQLDAQTSSLTKCFLDPSVNLMFSKMHEETQKFKKNLQDTESQLSAWKFTNDSQQGARLMARVRQLLSENADLGVQVSQGRTSQLEAEIALQKKNNAEMKKGQEEMNEFVIQLDEEVEGMQSTIQMLQQQLNDSKNRCKELEQTVADQDSKLEEMERQLDDYKLQEEERCHGGDDDYDDDKRDDEMMEGDYHDHHQGDGGSYYGSDDEGRKIEGDYDDSEDRRSAKSDRPETPIDEEEEERMSCVDDSYASNGAASRDQTTHDDFEDDTNNQHLDYDEESLPNDHDHVDDKAVPPGDSQDVDVVVSEYEEVLSSEQVYSDDDDSHLKSRRHCNGNGERTKQKNRKRKHVESSLNGSSSPTENDSPSSPAASLLQASKGGKSLKSGEQTAEEVATGD